MKPSQYLLAILYGLVFGLAFAFCLITVLDGPEQAIKFFTNLFWTVWLWVHF